MELRISYRHMEGTPSIEEKIREKAMKLKKYFHGKIEVNWVCSVGGDGHRTEINVHGGHHRYHVHAENETLYKTFDIAIKKIEKQLEKENSHAKNKVHRHPDPPKWEE